MAQLRRALGLPQEPSARGLEIAAAKYFGVAVYVKKAEFGPARVTAEGLKVHAAGRQPFLVQEGCILVNDGVAVPGQAIDVAELYRKKILGK